MLKLTTFLYGKAIWINPSSIQVMGLMGEGKGTFIWFEGGASNQEVVKETPEQILEMQDRTDRYPWLPQSKVDWKQIDEALEGEDDENP